MHIAYSLLAIILGFVIEVKVFDIVRTFGHNEFAEHYLGSGGTYTGWRLLGLIGIGGGIWTLVHPNIFSF